MSFQTIFSSGYARTLLSCLLVSCAVGLTHTVIYESCIWLPGGGWTDQPPSFTQILYRFYDGRSPGSLDNGATIFCFIIIMIIPFVSAYTFDKDHDTATFPERLRSCWTWPVSVRRSSTAIILACIFSSPAWQWLLIKPINDWAYSLQSLMSVPISRMVFSEWYRIQELWIFIILPLIILPIIYSGRHVRPRSDKSESIDQSLLLGNLQTLRLSLSNSNPPWWRKILLRIIPSRLRGSPPSTLYIAVVLASIFWWSSYLPEIIPIVLDEKVPSNLARWGQRSKIFIVALLALIMAVSTMRYQYRSHIAYVTAVSFMYAAFPYALGISIGYWFEVYVDETQPWIVRGMLIGSFYVVSITVNYAYRMIARSSVPPSYALALLFGLTLFEDSAGDLTFTEISPDTGVFWLASLLLIGKTIIRDLDLTSDLIIYLQLRYYAAFYPNINGSEVHDTVMEGMKESMRQWRIRYDRVILRHQNFLVECSSKCIIITAMTLDAIMIGSYTSYRRDVPWIAVYTPMRTVDERLMLIGGLIILWIIQTATHLGILYHLHCKEQKAAQEIIDRQNVESGGTAGGSVQEMRLLSPESPENHDTLMQLFTSRLVSRHWSIHQLLYLTCIPTFFYIALTCVALAVNQHLRIESQKTWNGYSSF